MTTWTDEVDLVCVGAAIGTLLGLAAEAGIQDDISQGLDCMTWVGGDFGRREYAEAHLRRGPGVVRHFRDHAGFSWHLWRGQPDYYYPDAPGSLPEGRYLEAEPFDGPQLASWAGRTRSGSTHRLTNDEVGRGVDGARGANMRGWGSCER